MAAKQLKLLKPNIKKVFLSSGRHQIATYLDIDSKINYKMLQNDIATGAIQFKPIEEMVKMKPSRFVLIESDNAEQGFLAVSYLAGIYAEKEQCYMNSELDSDVYEEVGETEEFDRCVEEQYEETEEAFNDEYWEEAPNHIPIITIRDLRMYNDAGGTDILWQNQNMLMNQTKNEKPPYWLQCTNESVCLLLENDYNLVENDVKLMQRFANNRHVYVLLIDNTEECEETEDDSDEDTSFGNPFNNSFGSPFGYSTYSKKAFVCEFMLEFTARITKVKLHKLKLDRYYNNLFNGWVHEYGLTLENRFPKTRIINRIMSLYRTDKAQLMEKVLLYIMRDGVKDNILTEKHFEVLDYFAVLSKKEEAEKKHTLRLDRDLVGMEDVKQQVRDIINIMKYNRVREKMGFKNSSFHNVHLLIGAPGTAKTTVAEIMGNMMREERLLNGNRFISINGADLKGMYVGHSAPKTKSIFDNYDIIFIDEAYSIACSDGGGMDVFSQEAIAQLIVELEKHATDRLVIFAGYGGPNVNERDNKMKEFIDANPGIKSRINSTIYFESYTPDEMVQIVHRQAQNMQYFIDSKADSLIRNYFEERFGQRDFGNGREARSLLEQSLIFAARRVMSIPEKQITKKQMKEICLEDVECAIDKQRNSNRMQTGKVSKCGFI